MNPLLQRQFRQHAPRYDESSEACDHFLAAVSTTYDEFQREQRRLEHALAVASEELTAANERSRHEAESQLAALHRRFEQTLESQQGMIVCAHRTDRGFVITLCRGELARRIGLTPETTEGRLLSELAAPANLTELTAAYERAWAGEEFSFSYTNARAGIDLFGHFRSRHEQGVVREVIVSYVEITALRRAEAALREREQLLSSINENLAGTIIYRVEHMPSGDILCTYVNPGTEAFVGLPPERFKARPALLFELIHPDDLPGFRAGLAQALRTGETLDCVVRLRHATEATVRWMHMRSRLTERRPDGTQVRDGSVTDVTALKETEAKLHALNANLEHLVQARSSELAESERLLAEIIESTSDAILVTDPERRLIRANAHYYKLWGFTPEQAARGGPQGRLDHLAALLVDPVSFRARVQEMDASERNFYDELRLKDGRVIERTATVLRIGGVVRGRVLNFRDVTARKQAEAALRESEEKFRGVFDHSPVIICLLTMPEGRIVEVNPAAAAAFGFNREWAMGRTTPDLGVWVDPAQRQRFLDQLTRDGRVHSFEAVMRRVDGSTFTVLFSSSLISIGGQPYSLNLLQDITARKESERARDHLLALTQATLESTADGILVVDTTGRSQTFNRAFAAMWRVSAEVVTLSADDPALRAALDQLTEPEKFLEQTRALLAQPLAKSFDTLHFKDGRVFERSSRPLVVHGEPAGRVWIFHDVTERMRAEQALANAHHHASVLAQLGRELAEADTARAAALAILEAARQLIGWDASWIEFWDEEKQAFENPVNFDLIDGERREVTTPPISLRTISPAVRTAMQEGAYLHLRENEADGVADSHLFGTRRRSLSRMFVPIRRADRLLGIFSIQSYRHHAYDQAALDLLQSLAHHCAGALVRIQARAALTESETRFRLVWERTADGMRLTDPAGRVVAANDAYCRMIGKPRDEIEGQLVTAPFAESIRDHFLAQHLERFARREPRTQVELQVTTWDGRALWVEVSECFIESDPAHPLLLGIVRDISARVRAESERKLLEESLRQSQKLESLGTLAGGIAHDFNNILTGMFGFIELARHDLPAAHPAQESLHQVLASGHRAKDLVRQILAFSRHQQGERLAVDLPLVVGEAVKLLRSTLPAKVELDTRLDPACPPILADPTQIHQIVMNLCTNAWHALPDRGGRILLTLESAAVPPEIAHTHPPLKATPAVCLTVADNGAGIPPEALPRIFEPFFTTKEVGKGTGLGLAVVHGIVGAHDGAITVQSALGAGTTFRLFFPALLSAPPAAAPAHPAPPRGTGQHILWIDDDPATNLAIEKTLVSLGYRVTACRRATDAIEIFCAAPADFALVLTDLAMPELSGDEVISTLRRFAPTVPMLVITGFIEPRERAILLRLGVGDVLHKPLTRDELAVALARHLVHS